MFAIITAAVCGTLVFGAVWVFTQGNERRLHTLIRGSHTGGVPGAAPGIGLQTEAARTAGGGLAELPGGGLAGAEVPAADAAGGGLRVRLTARLRSWWQTLFGAVPTAMNSAEALSFDLELVAICLQSGLPTEKAVRLAAHASGDRSGLARLARSLELGEVEKAEAHLSPVVSLIEFSRSTGVALAPLLAGLAVDLRRGEHRRRQLAAARLGVHLVIPLGVCILPSFILLGVVPVLLTLIGDMSVLFKQ